MYIVTGGAGFIGSVLVKKLNERGINDIVIVDNVGTSQKWKNLLGKTYSDYIPKKNFLDHVHRGNFRQVEAVIHMGACSATTEEDFDYLYDNNHLYSVALAEWCLQEQIRFIYASSAATYGNGANGYVDNEDIELQPLNRYGYSKYIFDLWVKKKGLSDSCVGLKFFNVYGPNEYHKGSMSSLAYKAFHQIKQLGSLKLFKSHRSLYKDGEQLRDFVYIKDCVDVILWFLDHPQHNGIFNVGTGKARTWNDLAAAIFKAMNLDCKIEYVDMPVDLRSQYQYFTEASMEKLTTIGFDKGFTSLEQGICDYYENYLLQENPYL